MDGRKLDLVAIAAIGFAILRVAATWTVFSATVDEPMHVSAALQLFVGHDYAYQSENPPLPRVVLGIAPWLGGMQFDPTHGVETQLRRVFYSGRGYKTNLVLARCGNLVFLLIAALATWRWSRRELGEAGGALAALIFTMQPMVLGHAGLGTLDVAATAGTIVALYAFSRWLDDPAPRPAALLGAAFGFAIVCKFSCIGYVPAACAAMAIVRRRRVRPTTLAIAVTTCAVTIWAAYGFTIGRLSFLENARDVIGGGAILRFIGAHGDWPLPAHWFVLGVLNLVRVSRFGFTSYALAMSTTTGWWWYFPFALALKTTLASLLLALGAAGLRRTRVARETLAASAAIVAVAMPSALDLGVRYVLPVYAPLSIAAAAVALAMLRAPRRRTVAACVALLAWHCGASLLSHPDEFPYFNELAGRQPWHYLADSNLDWGQDVLRLKRTLRREHVADVQLSLLGWHDYDALGFPPHEPFDAAAPPPHGWIAVSEHMIRVIGGERSLRDQPYRRVGRSIRLYHVDESGRVAADGER